MKFIIFSGTGIRNLRETANSADEALELVRKLIRLRRPGVRIEDELGRDVSFFELKDGATSEKSAGDLKPHTLGGSHVRQR